MEENNNQVIVDIGLDALIASLRELQKQYEANTAAMKAMRDEGKQDSDEYIQLTQANKVLRQEMNGVEKSIQNNIKAEKAQEGSLVQLRAQLANLNKQYDSMSGFERMGTAGEELRKKIKTLSDNISSLEANTGRYQRNVGNYKSALEGLSGSFKAAGLSTRGLDQSLKLLNGNPIVLFFTAIVTIVKSIINAFKDNESATMALKEAFAAFNPIIDRAKRGLEAFANVIVKVVRGAVDGLTAAVGGLLQAAQAVGNFFGADWHMGDNFKAATKAARELQQAENDYIKNKREWSIESAKIDNEVADLREKASQKDQYNAQQRLDFLDKAITLETKKAEKDKELAKQNLKNLQAEAARSANSAAMNEKLAEAERAVIEADTRLADTKRNLNRQRQSAIKEIEGETKAYGGLTKQVETLRKELEFIKAMSVDELIDAQSKRNKELADRIEKVIERVGLFKESFEQLPLDRFAEFAEVTDEGLKDTTTQMELFSEAFRNNAEVIESTSTALQSSFGSLSSIYKQMSEDETKSEEERARASRMASRWAKLQIAANSGTALAKGISGAMDAPTLGGKIAALTTLMSAILSAIAQAKALAAEGHEHGGVIGGTFTGATRGGDNVVMTGRRGELILNADQQKRLYDIADGSVPSNLTASLVEALRTMPAPVVEYTELQRFGNKVNILDNNVKLK